MSLTGSVHIPWRSDISLSNFFMSNPCVQLNDKIKDPQTNAQYRPG
jgi:hypothetical protein